MNHNPCQVHSRGCLLQLIGTFWVAIPVKFSPLECGCDVGVAQWIRKWDKSATKWDSGTE